MTYLYTVHLKPMTFVKNYSCAALVAMSPITSGIATWEVLIESYGKNAVSASMMVKSPLVYLVVALFAGITSREILMDVTDCESDERAGIRTIPVVYGRDAASKVAFGWSVLSAAAACTLPMLKGFPILGDLVAGKSFTAVFRSLIEAPIASCQGLVTAIMATEIRRLLLSIVGSIMLLFRAYSVVKSKGEDIDLAEQAVGSSLFSVLLVLASFV